MRSTIIKEISKKGLDSYLTQRQYAPVYWALFFPLKNVLSLDYTTLVGEQEGGIAASVISYDASSPLASRQVVSKVSGEIPKISRKRKMKESELNDYFTLSRMADADQQMILDLIYNDVDYVVNAVLSRMEWIALQMISKTTVSLTKANNPLGIVTETVVDVQMPTANKSGASVVWSVANKATMKPITDIKAVVKAAKAKGSMLTRMLMSPDTFDIFTQADEAQSWFKAYYKLDSSSVLPLENVDYVNAALRAARLPEITVVDQQIGIETAAGSVSYVNPFADNYVTFIPEVVLGNFLNGPIAEEFAKPEQVIQSKSGNVLVSKYGEVDPVAEYTKGEANCFPSWKNVNRCFSLYTADTTWA